MILLYICFTMCDRVKSNNKSVLAEDAEGYLSPIGLNEQSIDRISTNESDDWRNNTYMNLYDDVNSKTDEEPIYESISEIKQQNDLNTNTRERAEASPVGFLKFHGRNPQLEDVLFQGDSISEKFSLLAQSCNKLKEELDFKCLDAVKISDDLFHECFSIKLKSVFKPAKFSSSHLFFIQFKRILLEVIYFVADENCKIKTKFYNSYWSVFDCLMVSLIHSFEVFFLKNNLEEYVQGNSLTMIKRGLPETFGVELLSSVLHPKSALDKNDGSVKWLLDALTKNTKKYEHLKRGFDSTDIISVKIKGKTKYYPARYYIIGSLFRTLIKK